MIRRPPISTLFPSTTLFRSIITDPLEGQLCTGTSYTTSTPSPPSPPLRCPPCTLVPDSSSRATPRLNLPPSPTPPFFISLEQWNFLLLLCSMIPLSMSRLWKVEDELFLLRWAKEKKTEKRFSPTLARVFVCVYRLHCFVTPLSLKVCLSPFAHHVTVFV